MGTGLGTSVKPRQLPGSVTEYHRLAALSNKYLFLSLEAGKSKIMVPEDPVSGEVLLLGARLLIQSLPGGEQGEEAGSSVCSLKGTDPMWGLCPCDLITSQRLHLQILLYWSYGFNIERGGGTKTLSPQNLINGVTENPSLLVAGHVGIFLGALTLCPHPSSPTRWAKAQRELLGRERSTNRVAERC